MNTESYVAVPRASSDVSLQAVLAYAMALPRPVRACDALYVPQGLGELNRIEHTIEMWERGVANHLIIAGHHQDEQGAFETTVGVLAERFGLTRTKNVHAQLSALNTPGQTNWVAATCRAEGITSIALVSPTYHMLRQLLTLHVSLRKVGLTLPVIPTPLHLPPSSLTPATLAGEKDLTGISMVDSEMERITRYQPLGDVATEGEYLEYLDWLWKQPIIQNFSY